MKPTCTPPPSATTSSPQIRTGVKPKGKWWFLISFILVASTANCQSLKLSQTFTEAVEKTQIHLTTPRSRSQYEAVNKERKRFERRHLEPRWLLAIPFGLFVGYSGAMYFDETRRHWK